MKLGDHLVQCDITGQVCFASETTKTWRGLIASNQNWDIRHPQLDINVPPEDVSVQDARPFNSEDEEVGSDVLENGSVVLNDASIEQSGGAAMMTFYPDGTLDFNGVDQTGQWWNQGSTTNIGNFFQIRFTRYAEVGMVTGVAGITGQWLSLSQSKSIATVFSGVGSLDYYVEIKSIVDDEIKATAAIVHQQT